MDWRDLLLVVVVAVAASAVVNVVMLGSLRRALEARLEALGTSLSSAGAATGASEIAADDRFAEVAPGLVALARSAAESAMREDEVREWHEPNLDLFDADDVAESARDKLRRAAFTAVAARSALQLALRRHRAALPASIEARLRAFCDHLEANGEPPAVRRRRIAAELDTLEAEMREAIGADLRGM